MQITADGFVAGPEGHLDRMTFDLATQPDNPEHAFARKAGFLSARW
jgi:hypothetical protein